MVVSCQGPAPCSYIGEREEVVECRDQRSEKFSPRLSLARPVLCPALAAAWEIEHYESNVESFSAEPESLLCHCTVGCKGGGAIMGN